MATETYTSSIKSKKLWAFLLCSTLIMVAGWTMVEAALSSVCIALVAALTAFIGGNVSAGFSALKAGMPGKAKLPAKK